MPNNTAVNGHCCEICGKDVPILIYVPNENENKSTAHCVECYNKQSERSNDAAPH